MEAGKTAGERIYNAGLEAYGLDDARIVYQPEAVDCTDAEFEFLQTRLLRNPRVEVKVFGKTHHPRTGKRYTRPRHEAVFGKNYHYGGAVLLKEADSDPIVDRVMQHANADAGDNPFTWALVNLYRDGDDNVAMHRDDEAAVGKGDVYTYSFGATRKFVFAEHLSSKKKTAPDTEGPRKTRRYVISAAHGSCLKMAGPAAQHKWSHGIPVQRRVTLPRISITPRR